MYLQTLNSTKPYTYNSNSCVKRPSPVRSKNSHRESQRSSHKDWVTETLAGRWHVQLKQNHKYRLTYIVYTMYAVKWKFLKVSHSIEKNLAIGTKPLTQTTQCINTYNSSNCVILFHRFLGHRYLWHVPITLLPL